MGAIVARGPASAGMSLPILATLAYEPKADGYEDEDDDGCEGTVALSLAVRSETSDGLKFSR
jgi:hypothetical protein